MPERTKGLIAMIAACIIWGLSPIAFKAMEDIPPQEIIAHRALWSLVIFGAVLAIRGQIGVLWAAITRRRDLIWISVAALLILGGWWIFIWAIHAGQTTQTAMGFYIFPLVAVLFGRLMFGERLSPTGWGAVALAGLAVVLLVTQAGVFPWVALVLAANFALYGVIKKRLGLGPVVSVTAETLVMMPVVLLLLWQTSHNGGGHFGGWTAHTALLIFAGPLTAIPLILFSYATRQLTMTTTGLVSYVNPTLQFTCAVWLFAEPFGRVQLQAFALIWLALAAYSYGGWRAEKARSIPASAPGASG